MISLGVFYYYISINRLCCCSAAARAQILEISVLYSTQKLSTPINCRLPKLGPGAAVVVIVSCVVG